MKEAIEEALNNKNSEAARTLLQEWTTKSIHEHGFGIPEEVQREQNRLGELILRMGQNRQAEIMKAERRAKWMASEINWDSKPGSRGRIARLVVRSPDGSLHWFYGKEIEGVKVLASKYVKDGKWSHTQYRLQIQTGFAAIPMRDGFDSGKIIGGLGVAVGLSEMVTISEIADSLEVPVEEVEGLLACS